MIRVKIVLLGNFVIVQWLLLLAAIVQLDIFKRLKNKLLVYHAYLERMKIEKNQPNVKRVVRDNTKLNQEINCARIAALVDT